MRSFIAILLACISLSSCSTTPQLAQSSEEPEATHQFDVLVFSKTVGWRHDSIEAGIAAIKKLGEEQDFSVMATEESSFFTSNDLTQFEAVLFLNTTLDIFNEDEQAAFQKYIQQGGGFVGIHAAADTEYDWEWYGGLVGAYFESHPDRQNADVVFTDRHHPASAGMPFNWNHYDEWYNYKANPRADVHVIAVVEEKSYEGGNMGYDHPVAWAHYYDGGRAFYTGLGHTIESYTDPLFLNHLSGAIQWASGQVDADVTATLASSFDEVVLTGELTDPMEIDITNDGRVFIIEWAGAIKIWEPATNEMRVVGWLPVEKKIEDGLLGLALDPNFDNNGWLYIYYSPIEKEQSFNRLSRFTYDGHLIDMESEISVLEVANQRMHCCHSGGSVQFDNHGNLYLSTGDNSGGDREDPDDTNRRHADQGRTAGNTNDLRGKILRITPQPDGTYTIPEGNLFEADDLHRGEIYTMGHRNPFRISIDDATGRIYWGDVGPGGSSGYDEFNQAHGPGFFGWPFFTGRNVAFTSYHYTGAQGQMESFMNPSAPINASPYNTGARELPPAQPSLIPYLSGTSEEFPELGAGGINPMAGPIFHFDPETSSSEAFPAYYDNKWMIYEWMRNWVQIVTLDEDGNIVNLDPFLPGNDYISPIDIEVGPDGRLYIVEWGTQFWGSNPGAQLVRLDYKGKKKSKYQRMDKPALSEGTITITSPVDGGFFNFGQELEYEINLTDQALAEHAYVQTYTGFDTSPIPDNRYHALHGELSISTNYTHTPSVHFVNRFGKIEACVVEGAARACDSVLLHPKTKEAEHTSARENSARRTYSTRPATHHWGGSALTAMAINKDSRLEYSPVNLQGIDSVTIRFRAEEGAKAIMNFGEEVLASVVLDAEAGSPVTPHQAEYVALHRGGTDRNLASLDQSIYDGWREVTLPLKDPGDSRTLYLSFESEETGTLLELDFLQFNGKGISAD